MRTKALDDDPGLEFEFFLAQKLGRTRAELIEQISNEEFMYWGVYYARKNQQAELARLRAG